MKISKIDIKIRCDVPGCGNYAKSVLLTDKCCTHKVFLCEECITELKTTLVEGSINEKKKR